MTESTHGGWTNHETWAMAARIDNTEADYGRVQTALTAYGRDARGLARHLRTLFGGAFGDAVNWRELADAYISERVESDAAEMAAAR